MKWAVQEGLHPLFFFILPPHAKNTSPSFFDGWRGGIKGEDSSRDEVGG